MKTPLCHYEDVSDDRRISQDDESTLVLLCRGCAATYGNDLELMETNVDYGQCEECGKGWEE